MLLENGTPPFVRQVNCVRVLTTLREAGPLRLADIAEKSGLSRPTVGQVVAQLTEAGLVADGEPHGKSRPGRRPRFVRFRSEAAYVAGIDIGHQRVLVLVADLLGNVVGRHRLLMAASQGTRDLLAALRAATHTALADAGVPEERLVSVAAGTPTSVDAVQGRPAPAHGTPEWTDDLAHELRRSFRGPVALDDAGNLAAIAERWQGAARGADTAVVVQWGERVEAGILIGGKLHRGAANAAGGIGLLTLDPGATAERDERGLGPFDRMVGADAIAAADVCEVAARFVRGLVPMLILLDPDVLVIGGGVSQQGQALLDAIRDQVRRLRLVEPRLALSVLGEEAVALGAVRLALADAERRLLPTVP